MYVIVTFKERSKATGQLIVDIIPTEYPVYIRDGVLMIHARDGDKRRIPLINIHEWKERG